VTGIDCGLPECLFVQAVTLFQLVKHVLLERALNVVQDVVHVMLVWSTEAGTFVIQRKPSVAAGLTAMG
jgi:hypothetical protein